MGWILTFWRNSESIRQNFASNYSEIPKKICFIKYQSVTARVYVLPGGFVMKICTDLFSGPGTRRMRLREQMYGDATFAIRLPFGMSCPGLFKKWIYIFQQ